ncbi:MAG: cytochrome C [Sneathiella sp.]|nr:MAG: cytochrome C [Sneathiella sp.]
MQFARTGLFLSVALFSVQIAEATLAADVFRGNPDDGKALVEQLCSRCHGTSEDTESPFVSAPLLRELATRWPLENLGEALAEGISVGHPAMPEFEFSSREIDDLLTYLNTLKP